MLNSLHALRLCVTALYTIEHDGIIIIIIMVSTQCMHCTCSCSGESFSHSHSLDSKMKCGHSWQMAFRDSVPKQQTCKHLLVSSHCPYHAAQARHTRHKSAWSITCKGKMHGCCVSRENTTMQYCIDFNQAVHVAIQTAVCEIKVVLMVPPPRPPHFNVCKTEFLIAIAKMWQLDNQNKSA